MVFARDEPRTHLGPTALSRLYIVPLALPEEPSKALRRGHDERRGRDVVLEGRVGPVAPLCELHRVDAQQQVQPPPQPWLPEDSEEHQEEDGVDQLVEMVDLQYEAEWIWEEWWEKKENASEGE